MAEFTKVVPASCLDGSGLLLPAEFREAVVPETGRFTLQNAEGKTWPCTITRKQQGGHSRADITGGWRPFAKQNALQAGDEIHVTYLGKGVIKIAKTGRNFPPSAAKTPRSSGKTPKSAAKKSGGKTPGGRRSASKTPGTAGGVAKRRGRPPGSASAGRRRASTGGGGAVTPAAAAAEPAGAEAAAAEGPLPEYVPPSPEGGYLQPIFPSWCTVM